MEHVNIAPHSLTLEQNVLASLMCGDDCFAEVAAVLTDKDFYAPKHGLIFKACYALHKRGELPDPTTLADYLRAIDKLTAAGGEAYIVQIVVNSPATSVNVMVYSQRIKHYSVCRQVLKTCNEVMALAYDPKEKNTDDVLDFAESKIMGIQDALRRSGRNEPRPYKEIALQAISSIEERFNNGGKITGLSTGFYDLDEMTLGLQNQTLTIVAGRPSMGKTTLAINIAENIMLQQLKYSNLKTAGLIFSLEMSDESLVEKMLASLGKIDCNNLRKGSMEQTDFDRLTAATVRSKDFPLYIDQSPAITMHEIRTKARRIYKKHGKLAYIMIDYLQLVRPAEKGFSRESEIAEISRSLKALAKELNCPVVALSQLSRDVEKRNNKRPILSDLRESGQIEQDADLIMFVYRDEYYNTESKDKDIAELIVAKQRQGRVGTIRLGAELYRSRFVNLAGSRNV